jgi:hypothetical protein
VRTISYHGCKGQGKLSTHTQTKFKKAKKNQTSTCNLGKPKKNCAKKAHHKTKKKHHVAVPSRA